MTSDGKCQIRGILTRYVVAAGLLLANGEVLADNLEQIFINPPHAAKPRVMWTWMGTHVSQAGITRDLEALKDAGFGGTLMFHLADMPTTWSADIGKSPTPEILTWSEPWWKLVRHAAVESQRLGLGFGMGNCAGYGTSGGRWITPELSMQQICWTKTPLKGPARITQEIPRPNVNPRSVNPWPVYNSDLSKEEFPEIPARKTYYKDVALLALPTTGTVARAQVIDLADKVGPDGKLDWDAPAGEWAIYRFGHTASGTLQFPAQWQVNSLECDKMNPEAVAFHVRHVVGEIEKHLGDLPGKGLQFIHFDSYEAGPMGWETKWRYWTPAMPAEFSKRRGYDIKPFLPALDNRVIDGEKETKKFRADLDSTIHDLYRDNYFRTISRTLRDTGIAFSSEPYYGPWKVHEVVPHVHRVMAEFWSDGGNYREVFTGATIAAAHKCGRNIIEAEAFTSLPQHAMWSEYPGMLKAVSDVALCEGINRFVLHRFTHQPWDEQFRPGFTMGQWGTHFDRTQTWWEPGKALVRYWQRCQALLQRGKCMGDPGAFRVVSSKADRPGSPQPGVRFIQRRDKSADVFFVANINRTGSGTVSGSFAVTGKQPELWDPVTGTRRDLPQFEQRDGRTIIPLGFAPAQSWFIVFRKPAAASAGGKKSNFQELTKVADITGAWQVSFDPQWGGPDKPVTFAGLEDWTQRAEKGIRYYSGTAVYRKQFDLPASALGKPVSGTFLDLGVVNHVARVRLNGQDLGVVWTAPWRVDISDVVREKGNELEIEVTNVWANRLIGDEQEPLDFIRYPGSLEGFCRGVPIKELPDWFIKGEPRPSKGRYCFTTWNYFSKDSPLVPSGLLGPVCVVTGK